MSAAAQTIQICDQWPLKLRAGFGGHFAYLDTASKRNAACFLSLLGGIPQGTSVVEYFGGVGIFSTIIQNVIRPTYHRAFDIDDDCVAQLQTLDRVGASYGDAKQTMGTIDAQMVVLDFAVATAKHHDEWPWGRVCSAKPNYIVWSDTALRRLGLHRELYSRIFGTPIVSHEDYVRAYSRLLWDRYGYSVTREAHHVYSYMRAEPVPPQDSIPMVKVS